MVNILLDEEDFRKLTKGEAVEKNGIKIALQDIVYDVMFNIMDKNYDEYLNKK